VMLPFMGKRFIAIVIATGVAMLSGAIGAAVGFNSAGHARNKLSARSWLGFFACMAVLTLAICLFVFFWLTKEFI
jgi:hypothetical protein